MLDTLRRLTQALNDTTDLHEALAVVVHGVKERLAVDACSVYLVDASDTSFVLMATDGFDPRAVGSVRFARGEGLVGLVVERQRPLSLSNAQDHPRFRHLREFGEQAHHAFLGVPITPCRRWRPTSTPCPIPASKMRRQRPGHSSTAWRQCAPTCA